MEREDEREDEERRISRVCTSSEYRKLKTNYEKAKMLLQEASCSQSAAARRLGVTRGTVTRWMKGTRGNRGRGRPGYLTHHDKQELIKLADDAIKDHKPLGSDEILAAVRNSC